MADDDSPGLGPVWIRGAQLAGFIKWHHYTLLHTKYESFGPCGFKEDFFTFIPL